MRAVITTAVLLLAVQYISAQNFFRSSAKSVYALYGFHLPTKYQNTGGPNNLIGRKTPFSVEAGFVLDYPLKNKLYFRTGLSGHLHFLNETNYGIIGPFPSNVHPAYKEERARYSRGIDYIELSSVGIPVKVGFGSPLSEKYSIFFSAGPMVSFYFPAQNTKARSFVRNLNDDLYQAHEVTRIFRNEEDGNGRGISYPQLELDGM
jgi:hypothetical protein